MLTNAFLYAALLPLVVSATIAFIMRRLRSPPQIAWPAAIAVGFLTAQFILRSQAGIVESLHTFLQPHEAVDWLPHIVLLALGTSVVMYLAPSHRPRLIALAAALCLAAPIRLLSGNVAQHWSIMEKLAVSVSLAATLGVVWLVLASNDEGQPTVLHVPLQILVAVGSAIVITQSGAFMYGLACAAQGAAITGTALTYLGATGSASASQRLAAMGSHGASGIITFTLGSFIILGHFYAELSTINAALLFLAITATAASMPRSLSTAPLWLRNTVRLMCCLIPLAIAVVGVVA